MSKARIMIVEDEGLVALQMKDCLEGLGYEVSAIASSGADAIEIISETEPDLILMDIHLKGDIDGVETAGKIRTMIDVPLIYITAYSDDFTVERAKETEPFGYILKPISEKPLQLSIEMALKKAKSVKTLKENRELYSSILTGIGQGIIVADLKGNVKFINPYSQNATGWKQDEALGKRINDVFMILDPVKKTPAVLALDDSIIEGKIIRMENQILVTKKKKETAIDFSIAPLKNKFENVIGIVFLFAARSGTSEEAIQTRDEKETRRLPPKLTMIGDFICNWFFHKGSSDSRDLFNFFPIDKEHFGFYIVDTTGHSYTTNIFLLNLTQFLSPDPDKGGIIVKRIPQTVLLPPREVVLELNRRFYFDLNDNPFFTLIYGITNMVSGKTTIARAGHPYPIFQEKSGKIRLIESEGYAIGMFPEIEIAEYELIFEKGSRLVLYSDGLIDSTFADINQTSFSRLISFLEKNVNIPINALAGKLEDEEKKWHEKTLIPDDVIAFIIEHK